MNVERTHPTPYSAAPHPQRAVDTAGWAAQTEMFWSNACWPPGFTSAWPEFETDNDRSLGRCSGRTPRLLRTSRAVGCNGPYALHVPGAVRASKAGRHQSPPAVRSGRSVGSAPRDVTDLRELGAAEDWYGSRHRRGHRSLAGRELWHASAGARATQAPNVAPTGRAAPAAGPSSGGASPLSRAACWCPAVRPPGSRSSGGALYFALKAAKPGGPRPTLWLRPALATSPPRGQPALSRGVASPDVGGAPPGLYRFPS
jgi:hypothetical protein